MAAAAAEVALVKSGNPITKFSREPPPLRDHLRRSCTAEFSGFLLYKELGRRLKIESRYP
ncbi:unnamed protein product [Musa textilis]